MRVMNNDAKSHMAKAPEKCLQEAERGKKRMYLEACLQQRRHFSPFVASVDGLLGGGGDDNLEEVSQSPGHQVEENIIKEVWIRQE